MQSVKELQYNWQMSLELFGMWLQVASVANKCTMGRLWNLLTLHLQHNLLQGNETILLVVWISSMPYLRPWRTELVDTWASCISTQHFIMEIGNVSNIDTQP
jgi:hypothetical protein